MHAIKDLGGLSMNVILILLFCLFFGADVVSAGVEISDPRFSAVRDSQHASDEAPKKGGRFARFKKGLGKRLQKVRGSLRTRKNASDDEPAEEGPPPYSQAVADARADVARSRKGKLGWLKTKLGRSAVAQVCRPRHYKNQEDSYTHLERAREACQGNEFNKMVERFCTKQCNSDLQCLNGCPTFCASWLRTAGVGAKSKKRQVVLEGVRTCLASQGADSAAENEGFGEQYATFKERLDNKSKKLFVSGEKDCQKAGRLYARGLLKACVLLLRVEDALKGYLTVAGAPKQLLTALQERFIKVKGISVEKLDESRVPYERLSLDELERGFFERVHRDARRHVEAQWAGTHQTWTYDELRKACAEMSETTLRAYEQATDYEEPDDSDDDSEYDGNLYDTVPDVTKEGAGEGDEPSLMPNSAMDDTGAAESGYATVEDKRPVRKDAQKKKLAVPASVALTGAAITFPSPALQAADNAQVRTGSVAEARITRGVKDATGATGTSEIQEDIYDDVVSAKANTAETKLAAESRRVSARTVNT